MSYSNPTINANNLTPIGLDVPIKSVQASIAGITWMSKSFGRAYEFKEKNPDNDRFRRIPKVYEDSGEYINALPNDAFMTSGVAASSFIAVRNGEKYESFSKYSGSTRTAELEVIIWANLKLIDSTKDYIFTEILKKDVEHALSANPYVFEIIEWHDENVEQVFEGYDLSEVAYVADYMKYPFTGLRCKLTIKYDAPC